jgi:hypothetical protein
MVEFTETELERDRLLNKVMMEFPVVAEEISRLKTDKSCLQDHVQKLQAEILRYQHQKDITKSAILAPGQWKTVEGVKVINTTNTFRRVIVSVSGDIA